MPVDPVKNFAKVQVSLGYDASATTIVLNSSEGAKLPLPSNDGAFNLVWYNATDYPDPSDDPNKEIVRVTARSSDVLTVTRGQEGISATTKNTANKTYKMVLAITKKMIDDLKTVVAGTLFAKYELSIIGTSAPVIVGEDSTLDTAGQVHSRSAKGIYRLEITGKFPADKTRVFADVVIDDNHSGFKACGKRMSDNIIEYYIMDYAQNFVDGPIAPNSMIVYLTIEVRP